MPEPTQGFHSDNPIVQRLLAGTAPTNIRLAAARGALPITSEELLHVLFALREEADPEVASALAATLAGLTDDSLSGFLREPTLTAPVLEFFARHAAGKPLSMAATVSHRAVSDRTLLAIAAVAPAETLELIVTNQVALIRAANLVDTVLANPSLNADQRRRVLEVREEFFVKKQREEQRRRDEEERLARLRAKKEWTQQELEKLQEDLAREAQADREAGLLAGDWEESAAPEEAEEHRNATQRLATASVPERVMLAIRGSRTERNILIRDSNRLVATSAIKSPKITDSEVEHYAGMRNVSDEILRIIGSRREWLKSYSVVLTLVRNPRTPIAISINLLSRLQGTDLKKLQGDRNVPETLRRQAKQLHERTHRAG